MLIPVPGVPDGLKVGTLSLSLAGEEGHDSCSERCGHMELHCGGVKLSSATRSRTIVKGRDWMSSDEKFQEARKKDGKV
jgi:hypothetical protein